MAENFVLNMTPAGQLQSPDGTPFHTSVPMQAQILQLKLTQTFSAVLIPYPVSFGGQIYQPPIIRLLGPLDASGNMGPNSMVQMLTPAQVDAEFRTAGA